MRERRIKLLNNKYIIAYHIKIRNKGILAKQNYMIIILSVIN
jgi:hypothetical protein